MKRLCGIVLLSMLLTGCADEKILEKVGFMRTIAYERAGEGDDSLIRVSISIPMSDLRQSLLYSTLAKTTEEAKLAFDRQNNRKIVKGQLRQVLFDESLAKGGTKKHIDYLMRDPSVGSRIHVLVTEGDMQEMLAKLYLHKRSTAGEYIDNLIRTEARVQAIPDTNLYSFVRDYYDDGIEPVAAIIKENGDDNLTICGIALFRKDRLVARIQPEDKTLLMLLRKNLQAGELYLDMSEGEEHGEQATLSYIASSRKVRVEYDAGEDEQPPKVTIRITMKGSLLEYVGERRFENARDQRELEQAMGDMIQRRCEPIIRIMQQHKADCIGIGQYARQQMSYEEWTRRDWNERFAEADIRVQVKVHIKNYGELR